MSTAMPWRAPCRVACRVACTAALAATGLLAGSPATAQDRAELERTQITGNRELPKVLYIVPWKKPLPGTLSGRPVASVLDEALAPIDRQVLQRQIDYHAQAAARSAAPASPAPAAPPATR